MGREGSMMRVVANGVYMVCVRWTSVHAGGGMDAVKAETKPST
jgi:hypothetical protein